MNPRRKKWGTPCILGICIFLTTLWVFGVPTLWSQQANIPGINYRFGAPLPGVGPALAPYVGAPTYNPNAPSYLQYPGQSAFFQGMMVPPGVLPPSGSSFYGPQQASPVRVRSCQYSSPTVPPPPPSLVPQSPSTGVPVGVPWPGATDAVEIKSTKRDGNYDPSAWSSLPDGFRNQLKIEGYVSLRKLK
jgi:hypothetical protein